VGHPRRLYDALLLVSFGGPEGQDEVMPFLENVTRGRGIPKERLAAVGAHYQYFGGISPINQQNRDLLGALRAEFDRRAVHLPVFWGNRNWDPLLSDAVLHMRAKGVRRALAFFTSAYSSYSSCRQYRENIFDAMQTPDDGGSELVVERLGPYYNHAGFVTPFVDAAAAAIERVPHDQRLHLLFTTHSIPLTMAETSGESGNAYVDQHLEVANLVAAGVERLQGREVPWSLVYQSRSGPPQVQWLEPDIEDKLSQLAAKGVNAVVVVPIGFTSDHMEVMWDLDTQAANRAQELGLTFHRVATPGCDPRFVSMVADLVDERQQQVPVGQRSRLGVRAAAPDRCAIRCCQNLRESRPAIGGVEAPHG